MPATSLDAYGLMLSAIKDPNPVLFLIPKALMRHRGDELIPGEPADEKELKAMIDAPIGDRSKWKARWPDLKEHTIPIGKAKITREGNQITVVSYGRHLLVCNQVADEMKDKGISVEVIDLMTIFPYDWQTVKASIQKTGRVLFVNEDTEVTNFAEHLVYRTTQELFYELLARPQVLAGKNLPGIGLHPNLEDASVPQKHEIAQAIEQIIAEQA